MVGGATGEPAIPPRPAGLPAETRATARAPTRRPTAAATVARAAAPSSALVWLSAALVLPVRQVYFSVHFEA